MNLEKIKMILWDFDDTLCFHSDHSSPADKFDTEYNVKVLKGLDVYSTCNINCDILKFMQYANKKNIRQGLISGTTCYIHMKNKLEWVKTHYGITLENFCVSSQEMKLGIMLAIAEAFGFEHDEILLVDDFWENLERAADNGFQSATPVEVINYVNDCLWADSNEATTGAIQKKEVKNLA